MLRTLVEKSTNRLTFRRRLPREYGGSRLCVSPSAGLRYLFRPMRDIDPTLFALAREFVGSGSIVWDLGANIGLFSFAAAHFAGAAGRVICFEPDAWLVQLLRRSCRLQPASSSPVEVVPAAIAESVALRTFNIGFRSRSTSFLSGYGSTQSGGVCERQTVVALSLDWLSERMPLPDVIKIDVEGAELEILRGGIRLLEQKRPVVLCEVSAQYSGEVAALLKNLGYRLHDGEVSPSQRRELSLAPWSTIAIPARRS